MLSNRKQRLADSDVAIEPLRDMIKRWLKLLGTQFIDVAIADTQREWMSKATPAPSQLCWKAPLSLVSLVLEVDQTAHPRHSRLVEAIELEAKFQVCKITVPLESMLVARHLLKILGIYRHLAKYPDRLRSCLKKVFAFYLKLAITRTFYSIIIQ